MSARRWSIAAAKAELSDVVRQAQRAPQILENRGAPVAAVVAIEDYRRLAEYDARRAGRQRFLALSAELRAEGGVELTLPTRRSRPDPFRARRRRTSP